MRADYYPETGLAVLAWRPADEILPAPPIVHSDRPLKPGEFVTAAKPRQWVPCSRCHGLKSLTRFAVVNKTVDLATLVCDRCLEDAKSRRKFHGQVNPDGTVSITWDPAITQVLAPSVQDAAGTSYRRHWLPCSRCGRVSGVSLDTLAYVCEICEERTKP